MYIYSLISDVFIVIWKFNFLTVCLELLFSDFLSSKLLNYNARVQEMGYLLVNGLYNKNVHYSYEMLIESTASYYDDVKNVKNVAFGI